MRNKIFFVLFGSLLLLGAGCTVSNQKDADPEPAAEAPWYVSIYEEPKYGFKFITHGSSCKDNYVVDIVAPEKNKGLVAYYDVYRVTQNGARTLVFRYVLWLRSTYDDKFSEFYAHAGIVEFESDKYVLLRRLIHHHSRMLVL